MTEFQKALGNLEIIDENKQNQNNDLEKAFDDLINKGGRNGLVKKQIVDKNGKKQTVWVRPGVESKVGKKTAGEKRIKTKAEINNSKIINRLSEEFLKEEKEAGNQITAKVRAESLSYAEKNAKYEPDYIQTDKSSKPEERKLEDNTEQKESSTKTPKKKEAKVKKSSTQILLERGFSRKDLYEMDGHDKRKVVNSGKTAAEYFSSADDSENKKNAEQKESSQSIDDLKNTKSELDKKAQTEIETKGTVSNSTRKRIDDTVKQIQDLQHKSASKEKQKNYEEGKFPKNSDVIIKDPQAKPVKAKYLGTIRKDGKKQHVVLREGSQSATIELLNRITKEPVSKEKQESSKPKKQGKYQKSGVRHTDFKDEKTGISYSQGDSLTFTVKGKEIKGEFRHVNINKHSPKGYAVIRGEDGKLYERSLNKISKSDSSSDKKEIKTANKENKAAANKLDKKVDKLNN